MVTVPTFAGCLVAVRPIGVFEMRDEKGRHEKVLGWSDRSTARRIIEESCERYVRWRESHAPD